MKNMAGDILLSDTIHGVIHLGYTKLLLYNNLNSGKKVTKSKTPYAHLAECLASFSLSFHIHHHAVLEFHGEPALEDGDLINQPPD
jgi:hypothetical protein